MCLKCKGKPIKRHTKKEKVFYKILMYGSLWNGPGLYTPYTYDAIMLGDLYMDRGSDFPWSEDFKMIPKAKVKTGPGSNSYTIHKEKSGYCSVGEGGFHLFKNLKDAQQEATRLNAESSFLGTSRDYRIYKAIVPEGTAYINGKYGGVDCVVVKKVKYERI